MRKTPFLLIGLLLVSALAVNLISPITADEPRGTRNPGAGIEIYAPDNETGDPTDVINYMFDVKNVGNETDNFTITADSEQGWLLNWSNHVVGPVLPDGITNITMNISIPRGTSQGTIDNLTFTAQSLNDFGEKEQIIVHTTVDPAFILSMDIDGGFTKTLGVDPPDVANYTLTLRNMGNLDATVTLKHSQPIIGWQVEFPRFTDGIVEVPKANYTDEGIVEVNVTITAPSDAEPETEMPITIWAEKTDVSPAWRSSDIEITTIVQSRLGIIFNTVEMHGFVTFGDTLFNFTMENSGNKDVAIDLELVYDPDLIASLDFYQVTLQIGQIPIENQLRVRAAPNSDQGNYSINITARDSTTGNLINSTEFYYIIVPVLNITNISASKDEPLQYKDVTLTAMIENIGYVDARNITVKFYDGSKKIGEKKLDYINASKSDKVEIKWTPSDFGERNIRVAIDVEGLGNFSSHGHGIDIAKNSVIIPVEINWQPYYFIIFVIIVIILGVAVVTSFFDLRYYSGVPTGAGHDDYGEGDLPPEGYPDEAGSEPLKGEEEEGGPAPFGTESFGDERKEAFSYEQEEKEMFRPPPKPEPPPRERYPTPVAAETREPRAPVRDHELRDEISRVKDKLYKTKSLGVDTANIDNLLSMANRSLDAGDTDKAKQYLKYANERIDGILAKREEAVQAIREAKEVLSGMRDSADMTIVENFVVKADSLFEEGDFREAINYANKAKDRALRLQRREMRL